MTSVTAGPKGAIQRVVLPGSRRSKPKWLDAATIADAIADLRPPDAAADRRAAGRGERLGARRQACSTACGLAPTRSCAGPARMRSKCGCGIWPRIRHGAHYARIVFDFDGQVLDSSPF